MPKDLLLEIGLEEIPARFLPEAEEQLKERVSQFLSGRRIGFGKVESFSTPRRLAVRVRAVAEQQEDLNEEHRGPAKRIAVDKEGNWTKAALGFARGKGVGEDALFVKEYKGEEYVFVRTRQAGRPTMELLPQLDSVIAAMTFPKNMRWGSEELRFVRPIRWLVLLFGGEVVPLSVAGVQSGRTTFGHRFLGRAIELKEPAEYETALEKEYCLVDPRERRERILAQIERLKGEKGWSVPIDEELLEEVTHLVEYPTVLYGTFDESFLSVPREVLVTTMREHQRYFPVEDGQGNLLPYFIAVRNGDSRSLDVVARGNEKVLRARLSDARFFYEEDLRLPIGEALSRLENIVFHEELGTVADKARRVRELAGEWAEMLKLDEETVELIDRTAAICKFDLVTQMVYEFPELQGIMGEKYARHAGEKEKVARGIFEHYLPRHAGDRLPSSDVGAVVGLADKMDTLVGFFSLGLVPTGSQDPYGLRRQAQGIVSVLLDRDYDLALEQIFQSGINLYRRRNLLKRDEGEIRKDLEQFFQLRLKNLLQERGIRYDVIDAVLSSPLGRPTDLMARAELLQVQVERPEFKKTVEAFVRVNNLAVRAESDQVEEGELREDVERALWEKVQGVKRTVGAALEGRKMDEALAAMASLAPAIEAFFDGVLVMAEEERLRNARLGLLKQMSNLFHQFADFNKLVFPS